MTIALTLAHLVSLVTLSTLSVLVLVRLKSERRNLLLLFLFGGTIYTLGVTLQMVATTADGGILSTKVVFLGVAIAAPSLLIFIQQYCEQPLPAIVNILNYALGFFFVIIMWVPQLRGLIYETVFVYPYGYAPGVHAWGITRGVLYPASRVYPVITMLFIMALLIKSARRESSKKKLLFSFGIMAFALPHITIIWIPSLFPYVMLYNALYIIAVSISSYLMIFRGSMFENEENVRLQNTIKDMLVAISHDLKTPLTILNVSLEKLLTISPNAPNYKDAQIAYGKSRDLQRIIQNLIEVTRIDVAPKLSTPEWLPLMDLLYSIQEKYNDYVESNGLTFDINFSDSAAFVFADPTKIWSVFDNIIYNATRHTKEGGISITASTTNDTLTIAITDTGCGISPKHLPHIFKRFYKVVSHRGTGESGLGLYIVRSIMEDFCGKVSIESEINIGTTVILTFLKKENPPQIYEEGEDCSYGSGLEI